MTASCHVEKVVRFLFVAGGGVARLLEALSAVADLPPTVSIGQRLGPGNVHDSFMNLSTATYALAPQRTSVYGHRSN